MALSPLEKLGEELAALKDFLRLLEKEQALLVQADVDALLPLIEEKNRLADRLAEFSQVREMALQALQLAPGRAGVTTWLERQGTAKERQGWQILITLAGNAKTLNESNGKLINLHMQHNQQAFNVLMAASNRAVTYGPDGQQQRIGASRIIGTA